MAAVGLVNYAHERGNIFVNVRDGIYTAAAKVATFIKENPFVLFVIPIAGGLIAAAILRPGMHLRFELMDLSVAAGKGLILGGIVSFVLDKAFPQLSIYGPQKFRMLVTALLVAVCVNVMWNVVFYPASLPLAAAYSAMYYVGFAAGYKAYEWIR